MSLKRFPTIDVFQEGREYAACGPGPAEQRGAYRGDQVPRDADPFGGADSTGTEGHRTSSAPASSESILY